ncbi:MAG: YqgE/AlgH family protein [Thermoanaerobaculia bacterium]|nr:YqgE/AlgH family protein [Thermoanaerobaculia bacterium]
MPPEVQDLETPVLLLAMPQVQDPFFAHSVVLLLHHNDEGSFGFIANRPTEIPVAEILDRLEIEWRGEVDLKAFFGGPVQPQLGTVLYDSASGDEEGAASAATEVVPGLKLSQQVTDLQRLARRPPRRFRFFLGYAGWGEGQLVGEILRNDWLTAPVREDLLFGDDSGKAWSAALASVGVDPATLPSWTEAQDAEGAN